MWRRWVLLVGVLLALPAGIAAQQTLDLRARADEGTLVRRLFQIFTRVTLEDRVRGTTATSEIARLGGVSQYGLSATDEEFSVHLALDSVRVRRRDAAAPWQEFAVTARDSQWVQLTLDRRLRVRRVIRPASLVERGVLDQILVGIPGFTVPDRPIRTGDRWTVSLTLPGGTPGEDLELASERPVLLARGAVIVDSLVGRARDTLAFLSIEGRIEPESATAADGVLVVYGGRVNGTLVWSSGWGGVVSGAVRYEVVADEGGTSGRPSRRLQIETTVRHAVLP